MGPENNGFHGNRSTEPGMAARELVYAAKDVELAGLSNQTIKGCVWETGRPEKRTTLHQKNAKNCLPCPVGGPLIQPRTPGVSSKGPSNMGNCWG